MMSVDCRSVVIHGHLYQPPRDNPWFEDVEAEPSAAPYHDWNERIERECYRPMVAARVQGPQGRILRILNTLAYTSFNVGPTLLDWLERAAPETYRGILEADRSSAARLGGHGNAMAMPYHHAILPLSSRRDKVTEIRWGMADFRRRFGRDPVGMWLPETAVDHETLDVLAQEGIAFTVVGPTQVEAVPALGLPGLFQGTGGRTLAVFVYDGPISHDVAFGPLLRDAGMWAARLTSTGGGQSRKLVSVATDAETYGHHHRFGEMALAALITQLEGDPTARVENFASFLARHPPVQDIELVAPSSWSCAHGVERWRSDCGCKIRPAAKTQQRWRQGLREAIDWLGHELAAVFERDAAPLFAHPWDARDDYVRALPSLADRDAFLQRAMQPTAAKAADRIRALELLEMERDALRMQTSCGWFHDDLAGIEPVQVLRYAAHGIELAGADAPRLEREFLERLATAESNDPSAGTGRDIYDTRVRPSLPAPARVAAGHAALSAADEEAQECGVAAYDVTAQGSTITLTHRRSGRRHQFSVTVEEPGRAVTVCGDGGDPTRLELADFPEPYRRAVTAVLRRSLVARWLAPSDLDAVARGDKRIEEAVREGLHRAVTDLRSDVSNAGVARVLAFADLLELLGYYVPFDVQTAYHRLWEESSSAWRDATAPIGRRLGFAEST